MSKPINVVSAVNYRPLKGTACERRKANFPKRD